MNAHRSAREEAEAAMRARASLAGETFDHETLEAPGSVIGYPSADLLEGAGDIAEDLADDEDDDRPA